MVDSEPPAPAWERIAHHTHLYVLPAVGATSLALGGVAAVGMAAGLPRVLPMALLVAGASSLVGSLASYMCIPRAKEVREPDARALARASPPRASIAAPGPTEGVPFRSRSESQPHRGIGRATLAELAHMEDELWRRWASPQTAPLGAPLVGPVPETAYSPARAGGYSPFADRDRDIVVTAGSARPAIREPAPSRGSSGPVRASVKISPARARETPRRNDAGYPGGFPGTASSLLSGRSGELFDMDSLDRPAYLESINPILPRLGLGGSGTAKGGRGAVPSTTRPAARGGICSECSRRLLDFRAWVECRACRKPLCRECLQESFSTTDAGSCSDCRTVRKWSVNRRRGDRREEPSAVRWAHA